MSFAANVAASVLAGIILVGFAPLVGRLFRSRELRVRKAIWVGVAFSLLTANVLIWAFLPDHAFWSALLTATGMAVAAWLELRRFWSLGLRSAATSAQKGLAYKPALDLCLDSLEFAGIGASKLTDETVAFEAAVGRCSRPDKAVRLLLSRPDNEELARAARQYERPADAYQTRVRKSLTRLAELRSKRERNIEVRFHAGEIPKLRMMFIDDALCLLSPYVLGEGDGSDLPELQIERPSGRSVGSLYHALKTSFERQWHAAEQWDFKSGIDDDEQAR